jgi:hypothetical protein
MLLSTFPKAFRKSSTRVRFARSVEQAHYAADLLPHRQMFIEIGDGRRCIPEWKSLPHKVTLPP